MSFQNVKPTKPELNRIVKKKKFSQRGENLLEVKREQLYASLRTISAKFFEVREKVRANILKNMDLLKDTYKFIGKEKVERISKYNISRFKPTVNITYVQLP